MLDILHMSSLDMHFIGNIFHAEPSSSSTLSVLHGQYHNHYTLTGPFKKDPSDCTQEIMFHPLFSTFWDDYDRMWVVFFSLTRNPANICIWAATDINGVKNWPVSRLSTLSIFFLDYFGKCQMTGKWNTQAWSSNKDTVGISQMQYCFT